MIGQATCTDISPGMLAVLEANAARLGLEVETGRADAERLPFGEESFDLVLGHAVLHHIPDLARAPSTSSSGSWRPAGRSCSLASPPSTATGWPPCPSGGERPGVALRPPCAARPAPPSGGGETDAALESVVDVHAFAPAELVTAATPAWSRSGSAERSSRQLVRVGQPHARGNRQPGGRAVGMAPVRLPWLSAAPGLDGGCSSRACRQRSSTT